MIALKPGVRILGIRSETVAALYIVGSVYEAHGYDLVVTSVMDSVHSRGSEHYTGLAFDGRLHHVPEAERATLVQAVAAALGADFDVIHEGAGTPGEHVHVEYDPKDPY